MVVVVVLTTLVGDLQLGAVHQEDIQNPTLLVQLEIIALLAVPPQLHALQEPTVVWVAIQHVLIVRRDICAQLLD
jgi:hypothetical protein